MLNLIKLVVLVGIGLYISFGLILYIFQERLIFLPEVLPADHSYKFSFDFEERDFEMPDGTLINALYIPAEGARGVILYFHGNAGSLSRWGEIAGDLIRYGYDVLIYDYRGYGKSSGRPTEKSLLSDAQFIYAQLTGEYSESEIILFGRSLGTGIAVHIAANNSPSRVILETPYASLIDVASFHYPVFPHASLSRVKLRSDKLIGQVSCPILVLHGTEDDVVPYESGQKLLQYASDGAYQLITIPGGNHNDLAAYEAYWDGLVDFLK